MLLKQHYNYFVSHEYRYDKNQSNFASETKTQETMCSLLDHLSVSDYPEQKNTIKVSQAI